METIEKTFRIRNADELRRVVTSLAKLAPTNEKPYNIRVSLDDETRSQKQNRLSFLWYRYLGKATGHGEESERRQNKLMYGVPILLLDADFNAFYAEAITPLTYEKQLVAMDYVPITRLFSTKQFAEYLTAIDQGAATVGIVLPQPDDLYYESLMKAVA